MKWTGRRWVNAFTGDLQSNEPLYYFHGTMWDWTKSPYEIKDMLLPVKHSMLKTYLAWADEQNWIVDTEFSYYFSVDITKLWSDDDGLLIWRGLCEVDIIPPTLKYGGWIALLQAKTTRMLNKWAKEVEQ